MWFAVEECYELELRPGFLFYSCVLSGSCTKVAGRRVYLLSLLVLCDPVELRSDGGLGFFGFGFRFFVVRSR